MASKPTIISYCSCFLQVSWGLVGLVWAQLSGSACCCKSVGLMGLLCFRLWWWEQLCPRWLLSSLWGKQAEAQEGRRQCTRPLEAYPGEWYPSTSFYSPKGIWLTPKLMGREMYTMLMAGTPKSHVKILGHKEGWRIMVLCSYNFTLLKDCWIVFANVVFKISASTFLKVFIYFPFFFGCVRS